jgi:ribose 1,5-bisphosphokinase
MSQRLIYTLGPSGAGKDSLLVWLAQHLPAHSAVHFARRVIDRPSQADAEMHESLSTVDFVAQRYAGAFALHWAANGHRYGVRHTELAGLQRDQRVFVNGSRGYLATALDKFPSMVVLHITAPIAVLQTRLGARYRESANMIAARLTRTAAFQPPSDCAFIEIHNDGTLDDAGHRLLHALSSVLGWTKAPLRTACA